MVKEGGSLVQFIVTEEYKEEKLGNFLRKQGFSSRLIKQLKYVQNGLMVNGQYSYTNRILQAGDTVQVTMPQKATELIPENIPLDIVFENEYIMVVNKPAGIVVHPTFKYPGGTLGNGYIYLMSERGIEQPVFYPVMRLDRNTSGLVLLAKSSFAASFYRKGISKTYIALLEGELKENEGSITTSIGYAENSFVKRQVNGEGEKESRTDYKVMHCGNGYTLVEVYPKTGRTHQIRVHFSSIGHPLAGDDFYGGSTKEINRQALHCYKLAFVHPFTKDEITITAQIPEDIQSLIDKCFL